MQLTAPLYTIIHNCAIAFRFSVFLGVILDIKNLNWKSQLSHIATKVSKPVGIIYKSSFYLPESSLLVLYYSYPYCNIIWVQTYKTNLRCLVFLQKRVIRITNKSNFDAHTDPIYKERRILKLHFIYLTQLGQFMFSYKTHSSKV